jgi:hypothetical protein
LKLRIVVTIIVIIIIGILISFLQNIDNIITVIIGILAGLIPIILFTNFDSVKNNRLLRKIGIYDPLNSDKTIGKKDKIKSYDSEDDLPDFNKILKIEGLKEVKILSITSYVLILRYINHIKKAIDNNVEFTFLLLNPNSSYVESQGNEFGGGVNLKCQIESVLEELCKVKNSIEENKKDKLIVRVYDDEILDSIMIINIEIFSKFRKYLRRPQQIFWIKSTHYKRKSDAAGRPIKTVYQHDNEKEYAEFMQDFSKIWDKSEKYNCNK